MMKELKTRRKTENKFTVITCCEDYSAFPYDGTFPDEYQYYQFDTEEELLHNIYLDEKGLKQEYLPILESDIESIYFGKEDVTNKYTKFESGYGARLLDCWRDKIKDEYKRTLK